MTENEFVAEIERLTADRDLEKKWRKDAEDDRGFDPGRPNRGR